MKKLLVIAALALLTTACAAPKPKPCDSSSFSAFSGSSSPCGPEIEINASYKF
jgi:hypothetical protein